jgi:hypothetical protein
MAGGVMNSNASGSRASPYFELVLTLHRRLTKEQLPPELLAEKEV